MHLAASAGRHGKNGPMVYAGGYMQEGIHRGVYDLCKCSVPTEEVSKANQPKLNQICSNPE